jgi:prophage regulatory protein
MRVLRLPDVQAKAGPSRSTIYEGIANGTFPKPIRLGPKSVGWLEHEVDEWIAQRVAARDSAAA